MAIVKCDVCKRTIGEDVSQERSAKGGRCLDCDPRAEEVNSTNAGNVTINLYEVDHPAPDIEEPDYAVTVHGIDNENKEKSSQFANLGEAVAEFGNMVKYHQRQKLRGGA